jgi:succinyl-diaminopimelate desuccinylase
LKPDLLALTRSLVDIPSVSHNEKSIADYVERRLRALPDLVVDRLDDNVVARTQKGRPRRALIAGHLDTVPPNGNERARVEGDNLWGLGAADMKAGLAVMLEVAARAGRARDDLSFVFYVAEEVARAHSGLLQLRERRPDLVQADVAIICEPTGTAVQAGCQGVIKARITLQGARAHVSRPWTGRNAVHRLGAVLTAVAKWAGRTVEIDGCSYIEALGGCRLRRGRLQCGARRGASRAELPFRT